MQPKRCTCLSCASLTFNLPTGWLTRTSRLEQSGNPDLSGNPKGLPLRRKDAKINLIIYLCGLCGFARKFFITKCKDFTFKIPKEDAGPL